MFNDYLANESAKQHIRQRVQEAENFRLDKRIGATDSQPTWQAVALLALIGLALALVLLNLAV